MIEAGQNHTDAVLQYPFGVVALLHHGRSVSIDDHRQLHYQCLTETAGAGLADEIIGKAHVIRYFARESRNVMGERQIHCDHAFAQILIVPAHENQLRPQAGLCHAARNRDHPPRTIAAKHYDTGGQIRTES
jgi:hypothetical protein